MAASRISLKQLDVFLSKFRRFKNDTENGKVQLLCTDFARLRPVLESLRAQTKEFDARTAPRFNIFEVLGLSRTEVRLHSSFLGHLLDPKADHGQGPRFLLGFLEMARGRGLKLPEPLPSTGWWVETERFAGKYGRLDLIIEHQLSGVLLAIENKIDAGLRPNQLEDYRRWLALQYSRQNGLRQLIFLTPDGRHGSVENVRLSYRRDIGAWLLAMAGACPPRLRETILQYRQLTVSLTMEEHDELTQPAID